MKELISVIIPIYHVEDYLKECVDSVLKQTYSNLEIILVDDGSDDKCPSICDDYQKQDARIHVIHKENGGLSDARNAGLDIATGDYICFIDSDDVVHPNFIQTLYEDLLFTNSDMAICHYEKVYEIPQVMELPSQHAIKVYTQLEILDALYGKESLFIIVAWNKLYRKSIWDNLRYPKGKIHEDEFVIHHILDQVSQVVLNEGSYYYYRQREGSITNHYNEKRLHALEGLENRIQFYWSVKNEKLVYQTMYQYFFAIISHIQQMKKSKQYGDLKRQLKRKLFKLWKKLITRKEIPFLKKLKLCFYGIKSKVL